MTEHAEYSDRSLHRKLIGLVAIKIIALAMIGLFIAPYIV